MIDIKRISETHHSHGEYYDTWCRLYGRGIIISAFSNTGILIVEYLDPKTQQTFRVEYNAEGKLQTNAFKNNVQRTLYFDEKFTQENPTFPFVPLLNKGDFVLAVRKSDGKDLSSIPAAFARIYRVESDNAGVIMGTYENVLERVDVHVTLSKGEFDFYLIDPSKMISWED